MVKERMLWQAPLQTEFVVSATVMSRQDNRGGRYRWQAQPLEQHLQHGC